MKTFGQIIRDAREGKCLYLRQVAEELKVDQAIICKFEKGERSPTKEQVLKFASFFNLNSEKLIVAWLADKLIYNLQNEKLACAALKAANARIKKIQLINGNSGKEE